MARALRLILVGFGTVGQTLARQLLARRDEISRRVGRVLVVGVADSRSSASNREGVDLAKVIRSKKRTGRVGELGTPEALELIREGDADVLVELASAGGTDGEPGLSRIGRALNSGMHVVSSNKMPLAVAYAFLMGRARGRDLALKYGACVGGGIPFFEFADACTAADSIRRIDGVLNATSTYVLTRMEQKGISMDEALAEAQGLGYAETDPSMDIGGVDAACKIVILGNHILGKSFSLKDVKGMDGIAEVTAARVGATKTRKKKIRMVATVDTTPRVSLAELPQTDPLAVDGPVQAAKFQCVSSGAKFIGGEGAGGLSTSLAVLRDVLAIGDLERR